MPDFKQFLSYLHNTLDEINELKKTNSYKSNDTEIFALENSYYTGVRHFLINCLMNAPREDIIDKIGTCYPNDKKTDFLQYLFRFPLRDENNKKITEKDFFKIPDDQILDVSKRLFNSLNHDDFHKGVSKLVTDFICMHKSSGLVILEDHFLDDMVDLVNTILPDKNYDQFVPPLHKYIDVRKITPEMMEEPSHNEQIDAILSNNELSNEQKEALNSAKNILKKSNNRFNDNFPTFVERAGANSVYSHELPLAQKLISENHLDENLIDRQAANVFTQLHLSPQDSYDKLSSFFNDNNENNSNNINNINNINSGFLKFTDKEKNELLNLYRIMDSNNMLNGTISEQGTKIYGFKNILKAKENLSNAVNSQNVGDIVKYVNEYNKQKKAVDDCLSIIDQISEKGDLPANVSVSRNEDIPAEYRLNYDSVSKFNALHGLFSNIKYLGISPEEILDNPKAIMPKILNIAIDDSLFNSYPRGISKEDLLVQVFRTYYDNYSNFDVPCTYVSSGNFTKDVALIGIARSIGALSFFTKNKSLQKYIDEYELYQRDVLQNFYGKKFVKNFIDYMDLKTCKDNSEKVRRVARLLAVDNSQFDFNTISENSGSIHYEGIDRQFTPINLKDEVLKSNPSKHLYDSIKAYYAVKDDGHFKDKLGKTVFESAIVGNLHFFDENTKSATAKKVERMVLDGKTEKISKKDIFVLKQEGRYFQALKETDPTKKNNELARILADSKKQYDNRTWFAKLFFSSAKETKSLIDKVNNELVRSDIPQEKINQFIQTYDRKKNPSQNLIEEPSNAQKNKITLNNIKQEDENLFHQNSNNENVNVNDLQRKKDIINEITESNL